MWMPEPRGDRQNAATGSCRAGFRETHRNKPRLHPWVLLLELPMRVRQHFYTPHKCFAERAHALMWMLAQHHPQTKKGTNSLRARSWTAHRLQKLPYH